MRKTYSVLAALLLLAACGQQEVAIGTMGAKHMNFAVPAALTNKTVDLNNKHAVADALGIKLNGDPKQKLYDINMTAPSSEGRMEARVIPIRVDNLKQGSAIIYSVEGAHTPAKTKKKAS